MENKFSEKDKANLVEFLNFVAEHAKFEMNVKEIIRFYGLLAWAQQELARKIEDNLLEVKAVHEPTKAAPRPKARKK